MSESQEAVAVASGRGERGEAVVWVQEPGHRQRVECSGCGAEIPPFTPHHLGLRPGAQIRACAGCHTRNERARERAMAIRGAGAWLVGCEVAARARFVAAGRTDAARARLLQERRAAARFHDRMRDAIDDIYPKEGDHARA
jgi:hypothetical protein